MYFPFPLFFLNLVRLSNLAGTFYKKRGAFTRYTKPKNRPKFSDNRPQINPSHPNGFSLTTLSFLIPRKIMIYLLFSFSVFRHSILDIFLYFGYGWYCWFNLWRLSILLNYYPFFTTDILNRFTATFFWCKYVCFGRRKQVLILYS